MARLYQPPAFLEIECGGQIFGDIQARPAGELGRAPLPDGFPAFIPDGRITQHRPFDFFDFFDCFSKTGTSPALFRRELRDASCCASSTNNGVASVRRDISRSRFPDKQIPEYQWRMLTGRLPPSLSNPGCPFRLWQAGFQPGRSLPEPTCGKKFCPIPQLRARKSRTNPGKFQTAV